MTKLKYFFWSLSASLALIGLAVVAFFYDRRRVTEAERKKLAEDLRAKVDRLKAEEAERKAAAEAKAAAVQQEAKAEADRDSVDAANDLIASLRDGKGG